MIPVLGIPVLNRPDLLARCLASIDAPVERLVVIDNSATGELSDVAADVRPDAIVVDPPANLGVAASWNLVIATSPAAPWWCLVNADIEFGSGDLERLADAMATDHPRVAMLVEYAAFGLNAAAVETVGWFDPNFHPIYCEDTDYRYRCRLAGVEEVTVPGSTRHVGSVSYQGEHAEDNARTYPANVAYYIAKWGGFRGSEILTSPFGRGGSVADWTLDLARLRDLRW